MNSPQQNSLNCNNKHLQEEEVSQTKNSSINPQKITFPEWKILDLEEVETRDFRKFGFREIRKAYAIMKFLNQNLFFSRGRASTAPRSFPYHQRMATTAHHHTCSLWPYCIQISTLLLNSGRPMSRTFNRSHPSIPQTPGLKIDLYESAPHLLSLCVVDASLSSIHPLLSSNLLHPWCHRFMLICGGRCIRYLLRGSPFCFLLLPRGWWFQECVCVREWWFKARWKTARRPRGYRLCRLAGAVAG